MRQLRQNVNLEIEKETLSAALKKLARETATNVVVDPRVDKEPQTPVTPANRRRVAGFSGTAASGDGWTQAGARR